MAMTGPSMKPLALAFRIALPAICAAFAASGPASAQCDCEYREPCTIARNIADFVGAYDRTTCAIRYAATRTAVAYYLKTPRGEEYRIENPMTWFDAWYINAEPAVRVGTGDPSYPCYRTVRLQICFGR
jgi:hypothetical protein